MEKILESKRAMRVELASRPIEEKLRMLDALRERELAIRGSSKPGSEPPGDGSQQKLRKFQAKESFHQGGRGMF